jgi:hypothetical protein
LAVPYHPPVKHSVEIAGHKTSISLEPLFWDWLRREAAREGMPLNALIARIDAERIASPTPSGSRWRPAPWPAARAMAGQADQESARHTPTARLPRPSHVWLAPVHDASASRTGNNRARRIQRAGHEAPRVSRRHFH